MSNDPLRVILLVEDDPGDQELFRAAIEDLGRPVTLVVASDGEEALEFLVRRGRFAAKGDHPMPDLVVLDLNMPRVEGRVFLRRIRAHDALKCLPVVVMTTSGHENDVSSSYASGCNAFLTKPAGIDQLFECVRMLHSFWFDFAKLPTPVCETTL
ncbi:MAG TPA: response regulator [Planctomycetota bacterium]